MLARRRDIGGSLFLLVFLAWSLVLPIAAAVFNRSIDDSFGDSATGQKAIYSPAPAWDNQTCGSHCSLHPDISQAFQGTYTATTFTSKLGEISITMDFTGTAIYVFFILANNAGNGPITFTQTDFTLDNIKRNSFTHSPDTNNHNFLFNQSVFKQENLDNTAHTLVISYSGPEKSYVNFDYALYTVEDDSIPQPLDGGGSGPATMTKTTTSTPTVSNDSSSTVIPVSTPSLNSVDPDSSSAPTVMPGSTSTSVMTTLSSLTSTSATSSTTEANSTTPVITTMPNVSISMPSAHSIIVMTSSISAATSNLAQAGRNSKSRVSAGAVVGGVFGALIVVAGIVFFIFCRRHFRNRSKAFVEEGGAFSEPTEETKDADQQIGVLYPFVLDTAPSHSLLDGSSVKSRLPFISLSRRSTRTGSASGTPISGSGHDPFMAPAQQNLKGANMSGQRFEELREQLNGVIQQIAYLRLSQRRSQPEQSVTDEPPPY